MRTYEETHKWIAFILDTSKISTKSWLLLGQAQAKCEQIIGVPLLPNEAAELYRVYLAKGVHATTAIEGNSLTAEDVENLLNRQLELPPSKEYLEQEVTNILNACNEIAPLVLTGEDSNIHVEDIKHYNEMVLKELPLREDVIPGQMRAPGHNVRVNGYLGVPGQDLDYLMDHLCGWLNIGFAPFDTNLRIAFGILKAIIAHVYIAWIHPFGDGNGRTARLLELRILLEAGVPKPAAQLLSNHYNLTRTEYYRHLDLSIKHDGDGLYAFIDYALEGFIDGLDEQIGRIKRQQRKVHWVNYIHDCFHSEPNTPASTRRRQLVLDLSESENPVPVAEIRHVSTRIAEAFAGKTRKTVQRDLNLLKKLNLIRATAEGYRPNTEIMRAFLPEARPDKPAG